MNMTTSELVNELAGTVCQCGRNKKARQTFCYGCFKRLSPAQQQALYKKVRQGYEEAYADAMTVLRPKELDER